MGGLKQIPGVKKEIIFGGFTPAIAAYGCYFRCSWNAYKRDCDEPFQVIDDLEFKLDPFHRPWDRRLPRGLHDALLTTENIGECATYTVEYPQGKVEEELAIHPYDYPLRYVIKCHGISSEKDLSESNDRTILYRSKQQGGGMSPCTVGSTVLLNFTLSLDDGTLVYDTYVEGQPFKFTAGRFEVMPGLDIAVSRMWQDESAHLYLAPKYAYGPIDYEENEDSVLFDIVEGDHQTFPFFHPEFVGKGLNFKDLELVQFTPKPNPWELSEEEKRKAAEASLALGEKYMNEGRLIAATDIFLDAQDYLELNGGDATAEDFEKIAELLPVVYCHIATTALRRNKPDMASEYLDKLMKCESCPKGVLAKMEDLQRDVAETGIDGKHNGQPHIDDLEGFSGRSEDASLSVTHPKLTDGLTAEKNAEETENVS